VRESVNESTIDQKKGSREMERTGPGIVKDARHVTMLAGMIQIACKMSGV
jgi:hypothetical protein